MSMDEFFETWRAGWHADQEAAATAAGLTYEQHIVGQIARHTEGTN